MEPLRGEHAPAAPGGRQLRWLRRACREFGIDPARIRALGDDDLNQTYRVLGREGRHYCLKVHTGSPTEAKRQMLGWSGALLLRLQETGYEAPVPQRTATTNSLLCVADHRLVTVTTWLPGRQLPPGPGGGPSRKLIETVANFHRATATLPVESALGMRSWAAVLKNTARDHPVRALISSNEWSDLIGQLEGDLGALSRLPQVITHGDARTPNMIVNASGRHLIDWDLSQFAPAIFDLATDALWRAWHRSGPSGVAEAVTIYAARRGQFSGQELALIPAAMRAAALRDVSIVAGLAPSETTKRLLDFAMRRITRSREQLPPHSVSIDFARS
jgi:Ser/Thr protein kinase RdoA (MazF antagonist)